MFTLHLSGSSAVCTAWWGCKRAVEIFGNDASFDEPGFEACFGRSREPFEIYDSKFVTTVLPEASLL